jgi:hypothetical protein
MRFAVWCVLLDGAHCVAWLQISPLAAKILFRGSDRCFKNLCGHGSALNGAHEDAVRTSAILKKKTLVPRSGRGRFLRKSTGT